MSNMISFLNRWEMNNDEIATLRQKTERLKKLLVKIKDEDENERIRLETKNGNGRYKNKAKEESSQINKENFG